MKESGIEWIGEIPSGWNCLKGKFLFTNSKYIPGVNSYKYDRLSLTLNGVVPRPKEDSDGLQPKDFNTYQLLRKNELVFKLIDLQNVSTSRIGLSPSNGLVSPAYIILHSNNLIIPKYAEKFYLMMWHRQIFNALGDSGVRSSLNASELLDVKITVPNLQEQQLIANFLDKKCNEIDSLTSDIQKQIETLQEYKKSVITETVTKGLDPNVEMKDSGSIFAGFIPKRYNFIPLKYVVDYNIESLSEKTPYNYEFDYIDIGSVTYGKGITQLQRLNFRDAPSRARRVVKEGDVILSTVRTYLKATAFIKEINFPTIVSTGFITLTAKEKINKKYLKYIAQYEGFVSEVEERSNGVSYPAINSSDVVKIKVPLPPQNDQIQIADYLDKKCSKIDLAIEEKNKQLETLEQYKKSLIYEYVTGKKEVLSNAI